MNILGDFVAQGSRNPEITSRLVSGMKEVMLRGLDKDDELEAHRMGVVIAARSGCAGGGPRRLWLARPRAPRRSSAASRPGWQRAR